MRARSKVWLVSGVLSAAVPAHARDDIAYLVVTRDESAKDCPDAATLTERVNAILGSPALQSATPESSSIWIQLEMSRDFEGYRASIQTRGRRFGTRVIRDAGSSCRNLADATAVALAIVLDEPDVPRVDEPALPPQRVLPRPLPALPPESERAPEAPRETPRFGANAALEGGVALSVLEHPVPTVELALQGTFGRLLSLSLGVGVFGGDEVEVGEAEVELGLIQANLRACLNVEGDSGDSRLAWCAGPFFGKLSGEGARFEQNFEESALLIAVTTGLEARLRLAASFSGIARAALFVPVLRPGFSVEEEGVTRSAFEVPRAGGLFTLGFAYGS
jgi:hypothetical protein